MADLALGKWNIQDQSIHLVKSPIQICKSTPPNTVKSRYFVFIRE